MGRNPEAGEAGVCRPGKGEIGPPGEMSDSEKPAHPGNFMSTGRDGLYRLTG